MTFAGCVHLYVEAKAVLAAEPTPPGGCNPYHHDQLGPYVCYSRWLAVSCLITLLSPSLVNPFRSFTAYALGPFWRSPSEGALQ